jgi:hypothetical protein
LSATEAGNATAGIVSELKSKIEAAKTADDALAILSTIALNENHSHPIAGLKVD